MPSLKLHNCLA